MRLFTLSSLFALAYGKGVLKIENFNCTVKSDILSSSSNSAATTVEVKDLCGGPIAVRLGSFKSGGKDEVTEQLLSLYITSKPSLDPTVDANSVIKVHETRIPNDFELTDNTRDFLIRDVRPINFPRECGIYHMVAEMRVKPRPSSTGRNRDNEIISRKQKPIQRKCQDLGREGFELSLLIEHTEPLQDSIPLLKANEKIKSTSGISVKVKNTGTEPMSPRTAMDAIDIFPMTFPIGFFDSDIERLIQSSLSLQEFSNAVYNITPMDVIYKTMPFYRHMKGWEIAMTDGKVGKVLRPGEEVSLDLANLQAPENLLCIGPFPNLLILYLNMDQKLEETMPNQILFLPVSYDCEKYMESMAVPQKGFELAECQVVGDPLDDGGSASIFYADGSSKHTSAFTYDGTEGGFRMQEDDEMIDNLFMAEKLNIKSERLMALGLCPTAPVDDNFEAAMNMSAVSRVKNAIDNVYRDIDAIQISNNKNVTEDKEKLLLILSTYQEILKIPTEHKQDSEARNTFIALMTIPDTDWRGILGNLGGMGDLGGMGGMSGFEGMVGGNGFGGMGGFEGRGGMGGFGGMGGMGGSGGMGGMGGFGGMGGMGGSGGMGVGGMGGFGGMGVGGMGDIGGFGSSGPSGSGGNGRPNIEGGIGRPNINGGLFPPDFGGANGQPNIGGGGGGLGRPNNGGLFPPDFGGANGRPDGGGGTSNPNNRPDFGGANGQPNIGGGGLGRPNNGGLFPPDFGGANGRPDGGGGTSNPNNRSDFGGANGRPDGGGGTSNPNNRSDFGGANVQPNIAGGGLGRPNNGGLFPPDFGGANGRPDGGGGTSNPNNRSDFGGANVQPNIAGGGLGRPNNGGLFPPDFGGANGQPNIGGGGLGRPNNGGLFPPDFGGANGRPDGGGGTSNPNNRPDIGGANGQAGGGGEISRPNIGNGRPNIVGGGGGRRPSVRNGIDVATSNESAGGEEDFDVTLGLNRTENDYNEESPSDYNGFGLANHGTDIFGGSSGLAGNVTDLEEISNLFNAIFGNINFDLDDSENLIKGNKEGATRPIRKRAAIIGQSYGKDVIEKPSLRALNRPGNYESVWIEHFNEGNNTNDTRGFNHSTSHEIKPIKNTDSRNLNDFLGGTDLNYFRHDGAARKGGRGRRLTVIDFDTHHHHRESSEERNVREFMKMFITKLQTSDPADMPEYNFVPLKLRQNMKKLLEIMKPKPTIHFGMESGVYKGIKEPMFNMVKPWMLAIMMNTSANSENTESPFIKAFNQMYMMSLSGPPEPKELAKVLKEFWNNLETKVGPEVLKLVKDDTNMKELYEFSLKVITVLRNNIEEAADSLQNLLYQFMDKEETSLLKGQPGKEPTNDMNCIRAARQYAADYLKTPKDSNTEKGKDDPLFPIFSSITKVKESYSANSKPTHWMNYNGDIYRGKRSMIFGSMFWEKVATCSCNKKRSFSNSFIQGNYNKPTSNSEWNGLSSSGITSTSNTWHGIAKSQRRADISGGSGNFGGGAGGSGNFGGGPGGSGNFGGGPGGSGSFGGGPRGSGNFGGGPGGSGNFGGGPGGSGSFGGGPGGSGNFGGGPGGSGNLGAGPTGSGSFGGGPRGSGNFGGGPGGSGNFGGGPGGSGSFGGGPGGSGNFGGGPRGSGNFGGGPGGSGNLGAGPGGSGNFGGGLGGSGNFDGGLGGSGNLGAGPGGSGNFGGGLGGSGNFGGGPGGSGNLGAGPGGSGNFGGGLGGSGNFDGGLGGSGNLGAGPGGSGNFGGGPGGSGNFGGGPGGSGNFGGGPGGSSNFGGGPGGSGSFGGGPGGSGSFGGGPRGSGNFGGGPGGSGNFGGGPGGSGNFGGGPGGSGNFGGGPGGSGNFGGGRGGSGNFGGGPRGNSPRRRGSGSLSGIRGSGNFPGRGGSGTFSGIGGSGRFPRPGENGNFSGFGGSGTFPGLVDGNSGRQEESRNFDGVGLKSGISGGNIGEIGSDSSDETVPRNSGGPRRSSDPGPGNSGGRGPGGRSPGLPGRGSMGNLIKSGNDLIKQRREDPFEGISNRTANNRAEAALSMAESATLEERDNSISGKRPTGNFMEHGGGNSNGGRRNTGRRGSGETGDAAQDWFDYFEGDSGMSNSIARPGKAAGGREPGSLFNQGGNSGRHDQSRGMGDRMQDWFEYFENDSGMDSSSRVPGNNLRKTQQPPRGPDQDNVGARGNEETAQSWYDYFEGSGGMGDPGRLPMPGRNPGQNGNSGRRKPGRRPETAAMRKSEAIIPVNEKLNTILTIHLIPPTLEEIENAIEVAGVLVLTSTEMLIKGPLQFATVCSDNFGENEARVVCENIPSRVRFSSIGMEVLSTPLSDTELNLGGKENQFPGIKIANLHCSPEDKDILKCEHTQWSNETKCPSNKRAAVKCIFRKQ